MVRAVAVVLGSAFLLMSASLSALHVHVERDHDHPEHQHGLALHQHYRAHGGDHDHPRLEACDPVEHLLSGVLACAAVPDHGAGAAESGEPRTVALPVDVHTFVALKDVRVHGPPPEGRVSPRAPPLVPA